MACETVDTTANDVDTLGMSDIARIALRRSFEDGGAIFHREATRSILGNVDDAVSTVPSRRDVSGAAPLLDAILYDDVSAPLHASLNRAHMQSRELLSEANDR
jgi:hypothetical protein